MNQNTENKSELKKKLISIYDTHKLKIYLLIFIVIIFTISLALFKINVDKKNILISEKYVQAGLLLSMKKNQKANDLYEEIILSKNKFYSILSLNNILENNLEADNQKVLNYFKAIESLNLEKEHYDLLIIKKALFLIKTSSSNEGISILNDLINKDSKFKELAKELIVK
jgi:hypothetical protein